MSSQVMAESYGLVPCSRVSPIYLLENVPFTKTTKQWHLLAYMILTLRMTSFIIIIT